MSVTIKLKRATASRWTSENPTLAAGEMGYEVDTGKLKVGDGSTAWTGLPYVAAHDHVDHTYTHAQSTPSAEWVIQHNLGEHLNVTVVDSSGNQVEGAVTYQDANTIVVAFSGAFSGKAYLS